MQWEEYGRHVRHARIWTYDHTKHVKKEAIKVWSTRTQAILNHNVCVKDRYRTSMKTLINSNHEQWKLQLHCLVLSPHEHGLTYQGSNFSNAKLYSTIVDCKSIWRLAKKKYYIKAIYRRCLQSLTNHRSLKSSYLGFLLLCCPCY